MAEAASSVSKYGIKWQLAIAVGLPVVVGVGYWYYNNKGKKEKGNELQDKNKAELQKITFDNNVHKKISEDAFPKTPLELAIAMKEEGNKLFKSQKYEEAITSYQKAIELCPEKDTISLATFFQNKAAAYDQLQKHEEVKKACTKALSYNPYYTKALIRRAKACEQTKDLTQALEDIIAACILEKFQSQSTLMSADRILKELGRQHAKEAMAKRVPVLPSNYFIKTYFASLACDPIKSFLNKSYEDSSKGFLKAVDCFKNENYESIIAACTEEINFTEAEALYKNEALILRGTFYHLTGMFNFALSDLDIVINNTEANSSLRVNALIKRASIHMQLEGLQKCLNDFEAAIAIDHNNSDIYYHRGQIYLILDNVKEASEDFAKAVALNPNNPLTIVQKCFSEYRMAFLLKDFNSLNNALKKFEEILKEYPDCAECYVLFAQALMDQQEFEKADDLFQKAIKINPKNAVLFVRRAMVALQNAGNVDTAVEYINAALEVDDKCEFAYETLGTIEVQRGNLNKAIEMFEKAIALTKSELEMAHIFSLKDAAKAQKTVAEKMNMTLPKDLFNW